MKHSEDPRSESRGKLLHILGVSFGIAGAIGGTIGAGILRTPGVVAAQLGSAELVILAWIVGGIYALLGAISVAEVGASLPRSGGWYVYAQRAYGKPAGFTVGWMDWLGNCAGLAWVAITIGEYSGALEPSLSEHSQWIAIAVIVFFALIQLLGVRAGSGSMQVLSLVKAAAFIALVAACFILGGESTETVAAHPAVITPTSAAAFAIAAVFALQAVVTTYDGWYSPIYFAEEFTEPGRDVPRSLIAGVIAIIAIYVLVNLALLYVLPLSQMAASNLPVADAAQSIFGGFGGQLVTALALVSLLGLINAVTMGAPRILYGLSRDGLFFQKGEQVSKSGTPVVALLLTTLAAIFLVLTGTFERLLSMAAFIYVAIYLTGFIAVFVLRKREPDLLRPYKAWGYPWTTLIVIVGSILFLIGAAVTDTVNSIYAILLIAVSYPVYMFTKKFNARGSR
ncbi:MAG: APC family permease [Pyrinomonadaceae bacterium]